MYLSPNFAFNKDPKESLGFLLSSKEARAIDIVDGYQVRGSLNSSRDVSLGMQKKLPLGNPDSKGNFWILDDEGTLTKTRL
tara:strand:+ start:1566 stop:1808 length:243 start_codon:yes stop_codon:yes gene_type:complete